MVPAVNAMPKRKAKKMGRCGIIRAERRSSAGRGLFGWPYAPGTSVPRVGSSRSMSPIAFSSANDLCNSGERSYSLRGLSIVCLVFSVISVRVNDVRHGRTIGREIAGDALRSQH